MLTSLMEGRQRKCEQYWPQSGSQEYGPFMVNLIEEQVFADYTIRTMHLVVHILIYNTESINTQRIKKAVRDIFHTHLQFRHTFKKI